MIVFAEERFADIVAEVAPLWQAHYDEAAEDKAVLPLDMDVNRYMAFDAADILLIVTARRSAALVGYVFAILCPHLHSRRVTQALCDLHYLVPSARGGRVAFRLFEALEAAARSRGAVRMMTGTPGAHHQGRLLAALGWRPIETTYSKVIAA